MAGSQGSHLRGSPRVISWKEIRGGGADGGSKEGRGAGGPPRADLRTSVCSFQLTSTPASPSLCHQLPVLAASCPDQPCTRRPVNQRCLPWACGVGAGLFQSRHQDYPQGSSWGPARTGLGGTLRPPGQARRTDRREAGEGREPQRHTVTRWQLAPDPRRGAAGRGSPNPPAPERGGSH